MSRSDPTTSKDDQTSMATDQKPLKIGVLAYMHTGDGMTCLIRKDQPGHYMHGMFVAPGGKRMPNETPYAAAVRETTEEIGIAPLDLRLKGLLSFPDYGDSPFGAEWLCFVYSFAHWEGELLNKGPEGEVVIVQIASLSELHMWPGDHLFTPLVFKPGLFRAELVYRGSVLESFEISEM